MSPPTASVQMAPIPPSRASSHQVAGILLALSPIVSFAAQYILSIRAGTLPFLLRHPTVTVADWIFVPFNFYVVRIIDWRRGGVLYTISFFSVIFNVTVHAFWQYRGLDAGHMITNAGVVLPAGWVHVAFSTVQMTLLAAFVVCRRAEARELTVATVLATAYFLLMAVFGYVIHRGFMVSDVTAFTAGLFFVLVFPKVSLRRSHSAS